MQRRWQVHPDETGVVTREALIAAFIDAATLLDLAGGTLSVVTGRAATSLPGEMVTTGAVFEWRDRTDARAQPEAPSTVTTAPRSGPSPEVEDAEKVMKAEIEAVMRPDAAAHRDAVDANPDGFDYSQLQDEDVEERAEVTR